MSAEQEQEIKKVQNHTLRAAGVLQEVYDAHIIVAMPLSNELDGPVIYSQGMKEEVVTMLSLALDKVMKEQDGP